MPMAARAGGAAKLAGFLHFKTCHIYDIFIFWLWPQAEQLRRQNEMQAEFERSQRRKLGLPDGSEHNSEEPGACVLGCC